VSSSHSTGAGSGTEPAFAVPGELPASAQVWLVRHGETEWSRSGQHTGRTDLPLTERGADEARALAAVLAGLDPCLVLSSPRTRALRTAELAGLAVDAVDDDLVEWDYGEYEGLTTAEIRRQDPGWTVFRGPNPGGEEAAAVGRRADRVLRRAVEAFLGCQGRPVVLVGHGHFSRVLGVRWIGSPASAGAQFQLDSAAPSVLGVQHGAPVIVRWNVPNPYATDRSS
jgi:probable phosphoglycerate mutase